MQKGDVYRISGALYLVVQSDHLLDLNSVILVPVLPAAQLPALSRLTVDLRIEGESLRVRAHMPLTVEARRLRGLDAVHQLSPDEMQAVMDGLSLILWGF